jgi:hypothetical protein
MSRAGLRTLQLSLRPHTPRSPTPRPPTLRAGHNTGDGDPGKTRPPTDRWRHMGSMGCLGMHSCRRIGHLSVNANETVKNEKKGSRGFFGCSENHDWIFEDSSGRDEGRTSPQTRMKDRPWTHDRQKGRTQRTTMSTSRSNGLAGSTRIRGSNTQEMRRGNLGQEWDSLTGLDHTDNHD